MPLAGVATILRDPKWFAFADGVRSSCRKSRAAGEAGPSFDPTADEAPPAQHWPAAAVEQAVQQASGSKQPGAAQVTGLTGPDDKLPPVEQLRHVLGCASSFDRLGFSQLSKGCKDYASQYLRVADRMVALQQEYGVEEDVVVACYG